jgi:thioredoxin 1
MIQISDADTFKSEVLASGVPVLVDFYADWCGPCKMQSPILEEISGELEGKAKICKVNVDQSRELAVEYGIQSIPTLLVFKNGEINKSMIGLQSKDALIQVLS